MMATSLAVELRQKFPNTSLRIDGAIRDSQKKSFFTSLDTFDQIHIAETIQASASIDFSQYDLIILGLFPQDLEEVFNAWDALHDKLPLITDLSSVHSHNSQIAQKHLFHFIGSHPMCGTEHSGPQAYQKKLYENKLCFMIEEEGMKPHKKELFGKLMQFWTNLEMKVYRIKPQEHDSLLANLSHLPYFLSSVLAHYSYHNDKFQELLATNTDLSNISGGGLKSMIRIAGSNPKMWSDILQLNGAEITDALKSFQTFLTQFIEIIENKNTDDLATFLEEN